jgi:hypothetical protein
LLKLHKPQTEKTNMSKVQPISPWTEARPAAGTVNWFNDCVARGEYECFTEVTTLTPGLAAELLRRNPDNRNLRRTKVTQFASDIKAGRWSFNGEAFIVSREGLLNDGQHRAHAVVEANKPIQALFVFGIDRDTRTTVDQGAAKSACDFLAMEGVPNAAIQASLTRQLIAYERSGGQSVSGAPNVTNADVLERVTVDPMIAPSAVFAAAHSKRAKSFLPPALIGLCLYVFSQIDPDDAEAYMVQVCDGENIAKRDPAYTVRDRLLGLTSNSRDLKLHIVFRGWNAFRQGRHLTIAKVVGGINNLPALV